MRPISTGFSPNNSFPGLPGILGELYITMLGDLSYSTWPKITKKASLIAGS